MGLTNYDLEGDSLLDYEYPTDVTLQMLMDEIGGINKSLGEYKEHCAYVARWLLNHAKFEDFGFVDSTIKQLASPLVTRLSREESRD